MPVKKLSQINPAPTPPTGGDQVVGVRTGATDPDVLFTTQQLQQGVLTGLPQAAAPPVPGNTIIGTESGAPVQFTDSQMLQSFSPPLGTITPAVANPTTGDLFVATNAGNSETFTFTQMSAVFGGGGGGTPITSLPPATNPPSGADTVAGVQGGNGVLYSNTQMASSYTLNLPGLPAAAAPPSGSDTVIGVHSGGDVQYSSTQMTAATLTALQTIGAAVSAPTTGDTILGIRGGTSDVAFSYPQMQSLALSALPTIGAAASPPASGDVLVGVRSGTTDVAFSLGQLQTSLATAGSGSFTGNTSTTVNPNQITSASTLPPVGSVLSGPGIPVGTLVTAASGTTVTMSANATATATGVAISFVTAFWQVPFYSTTSASTAAPSPRDLADRWSDVINVLDFGADPTGNTATATATTAAFQAAINALASSPGIEGKLYIPPGTYQLAPPVAGGACLNLPPTSGTSLGSIVIEGAGGATLLACSCNGFIFDDVKLGANNIGGSNPWVIRNMKMSNTYPSLGGQGGPFYRENLVPAAPWNLMDSTIQITNASIGTNALSSAGGQIFFTQLGTGLLAANNVPVYIGYATSVSGLGPTGNATFTLGDVSNATSGNKGGAQFPSNATITNDRLLANQGYFATTTWTANASSGTPTVITLAVSNPSGVNFGNGLDVGYYYVWDWSYVTSQSSSASTPTPKFIGIVHITGTPSVPTGGWVGTTLTLTAGAQAASLTAGDLLMLSPMAGCIRHFSTSYGVFESLVLKGHVPFTCEARSLDTFNNTFSALGSTLRNCYILQAMTNSNACIGNIGAVIAQGGLIQNCEFSGCWMGARMYGTNPVIMNSRFEVCGYGIIIGSMLSDAFGGNQALTLGNIFNVEMEGTWAVGIGVDTSGFGGTISNFLHITNHNNTCYGLYLGTNSGGVYTQIVCSGSGGSYGAYWNPSFAGHGFPAGIYMGTPNPKNQQAKTFISCTAEAGPATYSVANGYTCTSWAMPTGPKLASYINCNNPPELYTWATLPRGQTGLVGHIDNGAATPATGNVLNITSGSFVAPPGFSGATLRASVGSLVTGTGISANTFLQSNSVNGLGLYLVNNPQLVAAGTALTIYPNTDGDTFMISDSTIPFAPSFTASGTWLSGATSILMAAALPFSVVPGMSVFDDTTNVYIGTVATTQVIGGTTLVLAGAGATSASSGASDALIFTGLTNVGAPVVAGGGTHHVRVRWMSETQNWVVA